ncbi:hypothetical protein [Nesterenkonia cremea]|uniref:ATP-grasp domain-containing protein n=1 Tax=Nesterenkonia cremea TaxID=1882340 RepID=A0A917APW5_9MICC|nr:hypothetical protein [Nesterenkonia cremea]GGE65821.1 hypothetical protein GCM10011401_11380 [Nesterenkonia cremea]
MTAEEAQGAEQHRPQVKLSERPGAVERFIAEQIEPRYAELREWPQVYSHKYLLFRAARRNKVHMKKITDAHRILFYSGVAVGSVDDGVTSLVSHQAHRVCRSTAMTRRYLKAADVPTPQSKVLEHNQYATAVRYWEKLGRRATVKPSRASSSQGATVGVRFEGDLRAAWKKAVESVEPEHPILIEAAHYGLDLHTYVVGEAVVSALVRVPFYILGDGASTFDELAQAALARRLGPEEKVPELDGEALTEAGLPRSHVPAYGSIHELPPVPGAPREGTLYVDVTDGLSEEIKQLAIDGLWALPGLEAAGVDLVVSALDSAEGALVVDIDPAASVADFRHPDYGKYRQPQLAIMEQIVRRSPAQ